MYLPIIWSILLAELVTSLSILYRSDSAKNNVCQIMERSTLTPLWIFLLPQS
jgi:hypothetical protein